MPAPMETESSAVLCDMSALYTGEASVDQLTATLAIFDPESGTLGTEWPVTSDNQMGVYNLRGFCSDGDKVYYQDGSRIMGIDPKTGESKIAAYTGEGMYGGNSYGNVLCEGGYYITAGFRAESVPAQQSFAGKGRAAHLRRKRVPILIGTLPRPTRKFLWRWRGITPTIWRP